MRTKNIALTISGILMLISSWVAIATAVVIFISRLHATGTSAVFTLSAGALTLIWAFINLCIGFGSVFGKRKNKQLKKYFALGIVSVILFIIQSLLSAANGIIIIHLIILAVCGFVIPCFHISVCRSRI